MPQTDFDKDFEGFAEDFLEDSGRAVTVNYNEEATPYNPSTNTSATYTVTPVVTIASPLLRFSVELINDTTIKTGDAMLIFAPEGLTRALVEQVDTITVDSVEWAIVRDMSVSSGYQTAMMKYQIRKRES